MDEEVLSSAAAIETQVSVVLAASGRVHRILVIGPGVLEKGRIHAREVMGRSALTKSSTTV
jgi:hypothetical protein